MVNVVLEEVSAQFTHNGLDKPILENVSLEAKAGEIVVLRGKNGTGKTTLLNVIAGIHSLSQGQIIFQRRAKDVDDVKVGFVQQDYTSSLLPWFSARENIGIPLRLEGLKDVKRNVKVDETVKSLLFDNLPLDAFPHQMSGGQKQRVAIARALASRPELLLLDEPFSNLDHQSSLELQDSLLNIASELGTTMIVVSHDLESTIYLADAVYLLKGKPATVTDRVSSKLSKPRRRTMLLSPEFDEFRTQLIDAEGFANAKR